VVVCTAVVDGVFGRERVLEHLRTDRQTDRHTPHNTHMRGHEHTQRIHGITASQKIG